MRNVPAPSPRGLDQPTHQDQRTTHRPTQPLPHRSWIVLGLWLALFSMAALAQAANESFHATIRNASSGSDVCLAFQNYGQDTYPSRYNWGHDAPYCGFADGKEELINRREAVWTFEHLGNDEYIISNAARGQTECLIFNQNGDAEHPERFRWGAGLYCGMPGGRDALLANRQAIWKVEHLQDNLYTLKNASRNGTEECLIFGNHGNNTYPTRYNWGGGSYCGFPGGKDGLLNNRQAVFEIDPLTIADFVVPQAWTDGYLALQNGLFPNQRLQVGHNGNGKIYVGWGDDDAYRWQVERVSDSNFFYLRNVLHDDQRLHVGHNGNRLLYASWGDDDAYQWTVEPVGSSFRLRNKKYPDQRILVGPKASFIASTAQGLEPQFDWDIAVLPTLATPMPNANLHQGIYLTARFLIENRRFSGQRMHAGHNGNGLIYTGSGNDLTYQWQLQASPNPDYFYLENVQFPGKGLRVDGDGSGSLMAEQIRDDTTFEWKIEPVGQHFFLTSRSQPDQRVQVSGDGSGHIWAAPGEDDLHQWSLLPMDGPAPAWVDRSEACRVPSSAQEVVMRVCFYEEENQAGRSWCKVLSGTKEDELAPPLPDDLPEGVGMRTRSVETENCNVELPPPTVMVYDEPGQRSDTEVISAQGDLGSLAENAHSFFLVQDEVSNPASYVCLYKGDGQTGDRHCRPYEVDGPVINLSNDFNDQVRSLSDSNGWSCVQVELFEHYDEGGSQLTVDSYQNLKDEPLTLSHFPHTTETWAGAVSSYQLEYGSPGPCSN